MGGRTSYSKSHEKFPYFFGIFPLPKIKCIALSRLLKVLRFFSLLVSPCPWPRFQCKLQKENLLWKENSRHVHFNQLPFDTKFATKIKRKQEMELFVTKASKQHRNMTFSPFVHPCINFFLTILQPDLNLEMLSPSSNNFHHSLG